MAKVLIPAQGLDISLPVERGQVFRGVRGGGGDFAFKFEGDRLIQIPRAQFEGDFESLPQINPTEEGFEMLRRFGALKDVQGSAEEFKITTPRVSGEVFTIAPRPDNPQSASVVSSMAGVLQSGISLQEQAQAMGTTPEILKSLQTTKLPAGQFAPGIPQQTPTATPQQQGIADIQAGVKGAREKLEFIKGQVGQKGGVSPSPAGGGVGAQKDASSSAATLPVVFNTPQKSADQILDDYKAALLGIDTKEKKVSEFLAGRKTEEEFLQDEFKKRGIEEKTGTLNELDKRIREETKRLRDYPETLLKTLQDTGVTQEQLNRLVLAETKKPLETLRDIMQERNALDTQINRAMNFAEKFADTRFEGQAVTLEALKFDLEQEEKEFKNLNEKQKEILKNSIEERKEILNTADDARKAGANEKELDDILASKTREEALKKAVGFTSSASTDDIKEYQFAIDQGFKGDFLSFKKAQQNELLNTIRGLTIQGLTGGFISVPSTELNNAMADGIRKSIASLPQNNRNYYEQNFNRLIQEGNTEGAKELIMSAVIDSASVDEQRQVIGRAQAIKQLNTLQSAMESYRVSGGDMNVFTGTTEQMINKLGATVDPQLAEIANRISIALFDYRRSMTGVQFSFPEGQQYQKIFPSIINLENLNTAKISTLKDTMQSNQEVFYRVRMGSSNYDKVFGGNIPEFGFTGSESDETLKKEFESFQNIIKNEPVDQFTAKQKREEEIKTAPVSSFLDKFLDIFK